ncbi:hypothetical protein ACDT12_13580, partial [Staphylococcus aureus]
MRNKRGSIKTTDGHESIAICIPGERFWITLVISMNVTVDFEVDNEYADEVVGYLNKQISACCWILPFLFNPRYSWSVFVRNFKEFSACIGIFYEPLSVESIDDRSPRSQR